MRSRRPSWLTRGPIWLISSALILPLVVAATAIIARSSVSGRHRPDVVLIVTDDQRWDTILEMPAVRRLLVRRGLMFQEAVVTNSLCCPSRSTILTGRYSHSTGVYTNGGDHGLRAFDDRSTVATWLDDAGYETGFVGKYFNGAWPTAYVPPGWDRWVAFRNARNLYYDYDLLIDGRIRSYGDDGRAYSTDVLAGYAERFIRRTSARDPLFLMLSPFAPHAPRIAPPGAGKVLAGSWEPGPNLPESDVSDKPAYVRKLRSHGAGTMRDAHRAWIAQVRALRAVDDLVARLVRALHEAGRLESTLIVFTSDNGIAVGEHGWNYKLTPYEESIRVPLVMRYDPLTDGSSTSALAANVDIAPTIADVVGVPAPLAEGRSLLPIIEGTAASVRDDVVIEHVRYRPRGADPPTYCALRTDDRLFVRYLTGEEELYDLDRDPWQLENLAPRRSSRAELAELRRRTRQLCRPVPPGFSWRRSSSR